jgi:hypothetical protein
VNRRRCLLLLACLLLLLLAGCRAGDGAIASVESTPAVLSVAVVTVTPVVSQGDEIARIGVEELWNRLQAGEAIVVADARSRQSYDLQHIAGAISMPEGEVAARASELPRDRLVVFYCA